MPPNEKFVFKALRHNLLQFKSSVLSLRLKLFDLLHPLQMEYLKCASTYLKTLFLRA